MKRISLFVLAFASVLNLSAQKTSLRIKGSDTCLPIFQKEAESYMKKNSSASITVVSGGSGVGIAALQSGTTDLAMSSRSMKIDEKMKITNTGKSIKELVVAKDALTVIVNPANKVTKLTREQLEDIFTGKIDNWKGVGGDNMPVVVYSRETSSGTYEFFKEHVLSGKNYANSALMMPATGAIVQSVSQTKGAIGYVGLAYIEKTVKAIKVSFDQGKNYITPSIENAKNGTYPITRPLYIYYVTASEVVVGDFCKFVLSKEGQKIVLEEGSIPLK